MYNLIQIVKLSPKNFFLYPLYALANLLATLLTYILSPVLSAWSVIADIDVLPKPFNWFHTHDNTLDGGQKALGWSKDVSKFGLFWQRTKWMYRNPAYGFKAFVLGFKTEGHKVIWESAINQRNWDSGQSSLYAVVMEDAKGNRYFSYRRDIGISNGKRYIKQWFGWHYYPYDGVHHHLKSLPFSIKSVTK